VPLSEEEARLGLYQQVSARWRHLPSCDWQCKPDGETAADAIDDEYDASRASSAVPPAAEPLSEDEARIGLYQVISVVVIIFTRESSYCFRRVLAIAILSVRLPLSLFVSQKRCKLGLPNFHQYMI